MAGYLADQIAVMNHGRIEEAGTAATVWHKLQAALTRVPPAAVPRIGTVADPGP